MANNIEKVCDYCGGPLGAKNNKKRFCSDKCRVYKSREKNKTVMFPVEPLEGFNGIIPAIREGGKTITWPPKAEPLNLEKMAEQFSKEDSQVPVALKRATLPNFYEDAQAVLPYQGILNLAKSGAHPLQVESEIARNHKLTPGQISMIRSKIKP
jgi:hypothetical protein